MSMFYNIILLLLYDIIMMMILLFLIVLPLFHYYFTYYHNDDVIITMMKIITMDRCCRTVYTTLYWGVNLIIWRIRNIGKKKIKRLDESLSALPLKLKLSLLSLIPCLILSIVKNFCYCLYYHYYYNYTYVLLILLSIYRMHFLVISNVYSKLQHLMSLATKCLCFLQRRKQHVLFNMLLAT